MHLTRPTFRRPLAGEAGIALPAMMGIMLVLAILTAGIINTVQADTPTARQDQDRKAAYAAAEAGMNAYLFRLANNPDVWANCTSIGGTQFVNQQWNGSGADPRAWRNVPGSAGPVHRRADPEQHAHVVRHEQRDGVDARAGRPAHPRDGAHARHQAQHHREVPPAHLPGLPVLHELRDLRPRLVHPAGQRRSHDPGRHAVGDRQLRLLARRSRQPDLQRQVVRREQQPAFLEHGLHGDPVRRRRPHPRPVPHERRDARLRPPDVRAHGERPDRGLRALARLALELLWARARRSPAPTARTARC